jgi:hypothetical protein
MKRSPMQEECLTASEVGLWLGIHNNTVKRIPPEELPFFRIGSRGDRRYQQEDIVRYILRRMVK